MELILPGRDAVRYVEMVAAEILWEGSVANLARLRDITERKHAEAGLARLNRVYALLSGINSTIVRVHDRDQLFQEACRIAVEAGQFLMAFVAIVDCKEMRANPIAWEGDRVREYLDALPAIAKETKLGTGNLFERAVFEQVPVISNDIQNDPRAVMKRECRARAIQSVVMLPLVVDKTVVAILALYAAEIGFFDSEEMKLLNELSGDISFALVHIANKEKVHYLAFYDSLTGLANRRLFHERLSQELASKVPEGPKVAVLVLDIERFRSVNETLGRQAGDDLLKQVADRLRRVAADSNWLARIGADQFATVIPSVASPEAVVRIMEQRAREVFGKPFRVGVIEVGLSRKAGVAIFPNDGLDADTLLSHSEAALRKAKSQGERYMFYAPEMTAHVSQSLALESKLRQAMEKDEFVLHYQPKIDARTRRIVGVEALIRWQCTDPVGLVPPADFIPLMEETGLIGEVGAWALRQAAMDHRKWVEQGLQAPRVAVNVSAIQLRHRDFVRVVQESIRAGEEPAGVDLEITESLVMQDVESNIRKLKEVRDLGLEIAVDDFGTGYSSLGYLAKLPIDSLKIDRSFIITMLEEPDTTTLVATIISLAHSLRLKVIAEGVDDEEQAKLLHLLRCDQMQGYLFSRPLGAKELVTLLQNGKALP